MSVNAKMTAIADKIRSLLGLTDKMGFDAMASNLGEVEDEVDTQANLITQILTILDSKSGDNTIYIGTTTPISDVGINGDIYIVRSE